MQIVVYTALYGNIDKLWSVPPTAYDEHAEWFCFTDRERPQVGLWGGEKPRMIEDALAFPIWTMTVHEPRWDNRRTARHYKAMPQEYFPDADVWIWLDANVRLLIPPSEAVEKWLEGELAIFKHPDRGCLYREAAFCGEAGKAPRKGLEKQVARYREAGMPEKWGLPETRCVIRRNTEQIRILNLLWWAELEQHSIRDQVSIPYCCWKQGIKWDVIPGRAWVHQTSPHFWFRKHKT